MSVEIHQPVFTIGHSNLEFARFVALLKQHGIQAVADVRSSPYSQFNPQFNREPLQRALREHGITYVFLGEELGARRSEPECYVNGRADYALIARTPAFVRGMDRITQGAAKMRIAMMCAEKDPLDCHRCILVSPRLCERGLTVQHILNDGTLESQQEAENRLTQLFDRSQFELFLSPPELIAEAYRLQSVRIAYQENALAMREEPPKYGD
jgi:uncharacterized protein (DUF488 family)